MEFLDVEDRDEYIKLCRVCLIKDVKMYDLQTYPLETYFEAVIGIPVISTMDLPPFLCYECATLVKKFSYFKERCLRGQATLYGILQNTGRISEQEIKVVDRKNLQSSLAIYHISHISPEQSIFCSEDDCELQKVKEEPVNLQGNDLEVTIDIGSIKEEDELPDLPLTDFPPSSDDEPLSIHKTVKEKKKGKKRGRKKKELVLEEILLNSVEKSQYEEETTMEQKPQESGALPVAPAPPPRKKGRPRKSEPRPPAQRRTKNTGGVTTDDVNLDEYVTIVTLTLEEQMEEINKRKESSNYMNAAYQCNLCYKGFIDTNAWKHHVGKHDPSAGDVECPVCKFRFQTRRALQKHAVNHEKKYACKSCPYVSKTTTQAKQHQRWHKGVTYTCEYCDEVSTKWTSYLSHVRIKHPSQHICGSCGYSFVSRLGLAMHRTMMHKEQEKSTGTEASEESGPYCQDCDVKFVSMEAYNRHMVTSIKHSQSNNFSKGCRVCGATFTTPEELRIHHRAEHARARPKNYGKKKNSGTWPDNCVHCGEVIANAREQWTHFRRAHPDQAYPIQKNYVCDVCGKSFRGNAFLTYHKRTHSSERQFSCGTCGKAFYNRTNLNMHARTHSAARPHACDLCCKGFKCKGALDRHYRSHTGVKPYECEVCGKAFGQSNSRKLHVRTVHLKQPAPYTNRARADNKRKLPKEQTVEHPFNLY